MCKIIINFVAFLAGLSLVASSPHRVSTEVCHQEMAQNLTGIITGHNAEANLILLLKTSLDPVEIEEIDASSQNLKLLLKNVIFTGLSNCQVEKYKHDSAKKTFDLEILCDVQLDADYVMNGHLLQLPIEGEGKALAKIAKVLIKIEAKTPLKVGKDGKHYLESPSWTYKYEMKGNSEVHFGNLFKGNKKLSEVIEDVIAKNGNEVAKEYANPIINTAVTKIMKNITHCLKNIPIEDSQ